MQQAICFFRGDEHRADMTSFDLMIDEEAAPTMRYGDVSLLPSLGATAVSAGACRTSGATTRSTPCSRARCTPTATG